MGEYSVYIHTFPNGKVYIGITARNPIKRWGYNGKAYRYQPLVYSAILKYGWDNIKHEILFTNLTQEEAEQKEIELIAQYDSTNHDYGYNIECGGSTIGKHSKETREKISQALKNHTRSESHCKNISLAKKGKPISEELKQKISEAGKGRVLDAKARENISKAKRGSLNPNYNKHISEEAIKKQQASVGTQQVMQCDSEGNIIKIWDSIRTASKELGIASKNIYRSCKSKLKAGGYKWEYI
jgi:group I intron endonuclease